MADPRDILAYDELHPRRAPATIDASTITYDSTQAAGSAQVGLAVKLSANGTVALTQDGDAVYGKLVQVESDGICSVHVGGYMTLPGGLSATLTAGTKIVGALGASSARGYIRSIAATTGSYVQGTATDTENGRGLIVDSSTATAVWVEL